MLRRLEIEDFGLIARAELEFAGGLTVCTGETGSGKTMLLGALAFVLGERTSPDLVRRGAQRARVTLAFEPDPELRAKFDAEGFELDPGEPALFVRELGSAGKSAARINGRAATAAQLREFGQTFVDQIGQHEAQRLLAPDYQLAALDRFAGSRAASVREQLAAAYARATALERELATLNAGLERGRGELEFARFAIAEIDAIAPEPGEDVRLRERRDYLANVERIAAGIAQAHDALAGREGSAVEALGAAASALASVARYGGELPRFADAVAALQSDATETAVALGRELDRSEFDPHEIEMLGARLDAIERLKKKYGSTIEEVRSARERFASTVEQDETRDVRGAALEADLAGARATLDVLAIELGALRRAAAAELERRVARELEGLAMPAARFVVALEAQAEVGPAGRERAEFALAPNAGEPPRALVRAASGGELSRVFLALVVVLADRRDRTALVFDEIDAGVAGATGNAVGIRLGALARTAQVVVVTHLAQIASWGDCHYALRKREKAGTTTIELIELTERADVVEELARMLAGTVAGVAVDHAGALLRDVQRRKALRKLTA